MGDTPAIRFTEDEVLRNEIARCEDMAKQFRNGPARRSWQARADAFKRIDAVFTWRLDMENAPRDRVIEIVARLPRATAGFPQYGQWIEDQGGFCVYSYHMPPTLVVAWAWRERTGWPQEPRA